MLALQIVGGQEQTDNARYVRTLVLPVLLQRPSFESTAQMMPTMRGKSRKKGQVKITWRGSVELGLAKAYIQVTAHTDLAVGATDCSRASWRCRLRRLPSDPSLAPAAALTAGGVRARRAVGRLSKRARARACARVSK